jgi:ATP-binding cassette subfamily F protein uup
MPVSYLSGGEQARILIARLMLRPADILILDEPTNDLDIPSLEVLEESLEDFPGALVLVTHDRFMLDTISTHLLALDGQGGAEYFADYPQWESLKEGADRAAKKDRGTKGDTRTKASRSQNKLPSVEKAGDNTALLPEEKVVLKALSGSEKKELTAMHDKIELAERAVADAKKRMEDPKLATNHVRLQECLAELHQAEAQVEKLFSRWTELESRQSAT